MTRNDVINTMKTKPLTFLLSLTCLFLFSGSVYGGEPEVEREYWGNGKLKKEFRFKNTKEKRTSTKHPNSIISRYSYFWTDEIEDGTYTEWYEDGSKMVVQHFMGGNLDGIHVGWHKSGGKQYEEYWENGGINGVSIHWYGNGGVRLKGYYKDGKLEGIQTIWHESKKSQNELFVSCDEKDTDCIIKYKTGEKDTETHFENGVKNGLHIKYYKNGKKKLEKYFKDGKENGLWREWSEDGKKTFQGNFVDGNEE